MIRQKWKAIFEDGSYEVEYRYSPLSGKTELTVDGDKFVVRGKPFGIGTERREPMIIGTNQAVLSVSKNGRATLSAIESIEISEIKL